MLFANDEPVVESQCEETDMQGDECLYRVSGVNEIDRSKSGTVL